MNFALILMLLSTSMPAPSQPTAAGVAPDFTFSDLEGATHSLAELRGNTVLLEFWAPWCIPCRKGFPLLDDLQARHAKAGLKVVAVTMETDDDSVADFVTSHPSRFVVGRDTTGHAGEAYEVSVMPTTLLIDRDGKILARFDGGTDTLHQQMQAAVEAALTGGGVAPVQTVSKRRRGAKGNLRAWERGYLADPIMNLDGDTLTRSMREHIHTSKEAAAGNGGVAGGGCGCN